MTRDHVAQPAASDGAAPGGGHTVLGRRSLAPDIARGLLLLFIALANVALFHDGVPDRSGPPGVLDQVVATFDEVFVVERSRPMFAVLFGFGLAMMAARMAERGADGPGIRRVLRRRSLWLMVFGAVHAALLFPGDILAHYGVTALLTLWLVNSSNRVLHRWFWPTLLYQGVGLTVLINDVSRSEALPAQAADASPIGYPAAMVAGLMGSLVSMILAVVMTSYVPLVIVGFWLFRAQWLTRPQDHLQALRRVFVASMAGNLLVSVPRLLERDSAWTPPGVVGQGLEFLGGFVAAGTGVGYLCGFALLAVRWEGRRRHGLPGVLAAAGERSMTAYLLQSVVFFTVLTGYGLGLGAHLGPAGDAVVAVATWALITLAMAGLARLGVPGPFETLIRRLTYGVRPPVPVSP